MKCRECDMGMIAFEVFTAVTTSAEGEEHSWEEDYEAWGTCLCCEGVNWENCPSCSKGETE